MYLTFPNSMGYFIILSATNACRYIRSLLLPSTMPSSYLSFLASSGHLLEVAFVDVCHPRPLYLPVFFLVVLIFYLVGGRRIHVSFWFYFACRIFKPCMPGGEMLSHILF